MTQIERILVPIDFSDHCDQALRTATDLAHSLGAQIDLIHVIHSPVHYGVPGEVGVYQDLMAELQSNARSRLGRIQQGVVAEGLRAEVHVAEGSAAHAIVEHAEKLASDLIVMGTRGLSGLKHVMLGSVAERTARLAPCPVMTVREAS